MEKVQVNATINAPKQKVWEVLWNDETYRKWTSVFTEGSYAESDWEEGSPIRFLDGKGSGMFSVIETKQPYTKMVFKHLGEVINNEEKPREWAGVLESYTLTGDGNTTELLLEMEAEGEYKKYFEDTFPKAIQIVKELAEMP